MSDINENKTKLDNLLNSINDELQTIPEQWHEPKSDELEQFKKSSFYHNWKGRFESLGLYGVLSIPNTTFEEWLWWFHEWAEALVDEFNKFRKQVYEALRLFQGYLDGLKHDLDNLGKRVDALEQLTKELQNQIKNLGDEINNIKKQINQQGDDINDLKKRVAQLENENAQLKDGLGKILQRLQNQGAWHAGNTIYNGDFNDGQSVASGTINVYGINKDGGYYIKTHTGGDRDGDIVQGLN